jgi:hypothetical protein
MLKRYMICFGLVVLSVACYGTTSEVFLSTRLVGQYCPDREGRMLPIYYHSSMYSGIPYYCIISFHVVLVGVLRTVVLGKVLRTRKKRVQKTFKCGQISSFTTQVRAIIFPTNFLDSHHDIKVNSIMQQIQPHSG